MKKRNVQIVIALLIAAITLACQQPMGMVDADASIKGTYQTWDASAVYVGGDRVSWGGHNWQAGWWTTGEEPGTTGQWGVWTDLGPDTSVTATPTVPATATATSTATNTPTVGPTATFTPTAGPTNTPTVAPTATNTVVVTPTFTPTQGSSLYPTWDSGAVYTGGNKVSWNGSDWEAKWWTQGEEPGIAGVWKNIGGNPATPTPTATTDPNITPTPTPTVDDLVLGVPRVLTDQEIIDRWGGIDPNTLPDALANAVSSLLTQTQYESLFPNRFGSQTWIDLNAGKTPFDYYSYQNLIDAVKELAVVMLKVETKNYASRVIRFHKITKEEELIRVDADWDADWLKNVVPKVEVVDYGLFLNEGTLVEKKRDLAAFLGNISHETTGGWSTAPGGPYAWGLYWKEEVGHDDNSVGGYVSANDPNYPPNPAESYHGRGPIQLSWNYNYGYMSQVIFGDKNILLNDPDRVAHDGKLGFMTGIWFWMTPQSPKPACHDVMVGNWEPTPEDIAANRLPGFGVTINVINGGLEAGRPNDYRVVDRIGFYEAICTEMGITTGPNVDCFTQQPF